MTDTTQQKTPNVPMFNITTRGAAVDSLKRNPQFRGKEVGNILSAVEASPNDWSLPLNPVETSLVFLGVMSGAHSLQTPVMITLDREFWSEMHKQDVHTKNGSHAKEVFCPDPRAVTILFNLNPQEASA
ncbi:hypothetical protein BBC27_00490 [Acidithiobacillus ferrivorans]|uniref:Uncharacterized protein n=1 Tax=Acidithiobacillus ferrivorans TaxID=160808 RepID=A0A1B9C0X2_9PROT|nr:hypothetical protein [Acidithiobacillus ferrivorans]OCB03617.1 hypothetical protein BBC27_00490 [Acidithiobacillus ferrivorans]